MNSAWSKTGCQVRRKLPQIRFPQQHQDYQCFKTNQSLNDIEDPQSKQRRHEFVIVVDDKVTGFAPLGTIFQAVQDFADLITDVIEFRVVVSSPESIPAEGSEIDVEFDMCHERCQLMAQRFCDGVKDRESQAVVAVVAAYHLYHLVSNGFAGVDDAEVGLGGFSESDGDASRGSDGVSFFIRSQACVDHIASEVCVDHIADLTRK